MSILRHPTLWHFRRSPERGQLPVGGSSSKTPTTLQSRWMREPATGLTVYGSRRTRQATRPYWLRHRSSAASGPSNWRCLPYVAWHPVLRSPGSCPVMSMVCHRGLMLETMLPVLCKATVEQFLFILCIDKSYLAGSSAIQTQNKSFSFNSSPCHKITIPRLNAVVPRQHMVSDICGQIGLCQLTVAVPSSPICALSSSDTVVATLTTIHSSARPPEPNAFSAAAKVLSAIL
jgi:hypothetical protein